MLLIKKIKSDADIEAVKLRDPGAESRIFVLREVEGRSFFYPMNPLHKSEQSSFLGLKKKCRWDGGYYISKAQFDLALDGVVKASSMPRPLLAAMRLTVAGFNFDADMAEIISCMQNDELHSEALDQCMQQKKEQLFYELEQVLYTQQNAAAGTVQSVKSTPEQITDLMLKVMTAAFPCLYLQISFAEITEQLSEAELRAKRDAEELVKLQQKFNQDLAIEQASSNYKLAMQDLAENEREVDFSLQLHDLDRKLALQSKAEELKIAQSESEVKRAELTLKLEQIAAERKNIQLNAERENQLKAAIAESQARHADEKAAVEVELLKAQLRKEQLAAETLARELQQIPQDPLMPLKKRYSNYRICNLDRNAVPNQLISVIQAQSLTGNHVEISKAGVQKSYFQPRGVCMEQCEEDLITVGCPMEVRFRSNRTGYLTMLCIDSADHIDVIMPNCIDKQVRIAADGNYILPAPDGSLLKNIRIRQTGPEGRERFAAIVSDEPLLPTPQGNGFASLSSVELEALIGKLNDMPQDSWSAGYITYTVQTAE